MEGINAVDNFSMKLENKLLLHYFYSSAFIVKEQGSIVL